MLASLLNLKTPQSEVNLDVPGMYIQYYSAAPGRSTVYDVSKDGTILMTEFECWPLGERPSWADVRG